MTRLDAIRYPNQTRFPYYCFFESITLENLSAVVPNTAAIVINSIADINSAGVTSNAGFKPFDFAGEILCPFKLRISFSSRYSNS